MGPATKLDKALLDFLALECPFLLAAARLGIEPGKCVAVEDSANGVKSAKAAGCHVVGIDREGDGHLAHADRVVKTMDEI